MTLRLFDMQGRELQYIATATGSSFQILPFEGMGILTAQGQGGIQAFKILGR